MSGRTEDFPPEVAPLPPLTSSRLPALLNRMLGLTDGRDLVEVRWAGGRLVVRVETLDDARRIVGEFLENVGEGAAVGPVLTIDGDLVWTGDLATVPAYTATVVVGWRPPRGPDVVDGLRHRDGPKGVDW